MMTTYSVPSGTFSYSNTLTATAADTVTFADRAGYVTAANLGSSVIYARADGQAATVGGEGCYVVLPGESAILANGLPIWYQSSRVIPQGVNEFGGGNTSSSAASPGMIESQTSLAGQMTNPGTTVSVISPAAESYTIAFAG
jgi:hypothetical protein